MKTLGNILWFALAGVWLALGWLFWAAVLAITVVGCVARQCVKLARFSLWPFGRVALPDPTATKLGGIGAVLRHPIRGTDIQARRARACPVRQEDRKGEYGAGNATRSCLTSQRADP